MSEMGLDFLGIDCTICFCLAVHQLLCWQLYKGEIQRHGKRIAVPFIWKYCESSKIVASGLEKNVLWISDWSSPRPTFIPLWDHAWVARKALPRRFREDLKIPNCVNHLEAWLVLLTQTMRLWWKRIRGRLQTLWKFVDFGRVLV